jgi:thiamine biosynthesis lipoprotein
MKKIWAVINLILISVLFSACTQISVENSLAISSMHTFIGGTVYAPKSVFNKADKKLKEMYDFYNKLTDNYRGYEDVQGIYYINQLVETTKTDQTVEIRKELYDLLSLGVELYEFTDGYFDMSIGKIIDVWKNLIDESDYTGQEIPKEDIDYAISLVDTIDIVENPVILSEVDNKYYVTLKYGAKLDLGALAKGYVTQLAADYLKDLGISKYLISGGGSSMLYGEGNPKTEDGSYRTGLINPQDVIDNLDIIGYRPKNYGIYTSKNYNFTTSGTYNQFIVSENVMYHHIVSPKTKRPVNHYLTLSIVGTDAGFNDGLSTALFSMPPEVLEQFLETNGYEVYTYLFNNTYKSYNQSENFRPL